MYQLDVYLTQAINGLSGRSDIADFIMIWASGAGIPLMVSAVAAQWWRRERRPHVRHALVATGLSFLLGELLNQVIGTPIDRVRPFVAGVSHLMMSPSADFSFPSDHATAGVAIAAAFFLHRMFRTGMLFGSAALPVCISRVYVGEHYLSDVLGGAATAWLAALAVRYAYPEGTTLDRRITRIL